MILLQTVQKEKLMATKKKPAKKKTAAAPKVVTRVEYKNHLSAGELTAMILIAIIMFSLGFYCGLTWMKGKIADTALEMTMMTGKRPRKMNDGSAQGIIDDAMDAAMQVGEANALMQKPDVDMLLPEVEE